MNDKLLSVKEGNKKFVSAEKAGLSIEGLKNLLLQQMGAYRPLTSIEESLEYNEICAIRMEELIYAVRRERDEITTKRERERAVKIIDSTLKIPFENYLDVQAVKKKILEEK